MGFGRAIVGAILGSGIGEALNLAVDPSFMVDDEHLKALTDLVKDNPDAFKGAVTYAPDPVAAAAPAAAVPVTPQPFNPNYVTVADTATAAAPAAAPSVTLPTDGDIMQIEGGKLHFAEDYATKLSAQAKTLLQGAGEAGKYFLPSESGITTWTDEMAKKWQDYFKAEGMSSSQIEGAITTLKDQVTAAADKLGDTKFLQDWSTSHLASVVTGGVGGGVLGLVTGNDPKPVMGRYTQAEAIRLGGRAGGAALPSDMAAQAPAGSHTDKFLQKMHEQEGQRGPSPA